jgi:hypothetical protein
LQVTDHRGVSQPFGLATWWPRSSPVCEHVPDRLHLAGATNVSVVSSTASRCFPCAGGKSQLSENAKAMTIVCQICRQSFLCNMTAAKLKEHSDSRHPKQAFAECFPSHAGQA